MIILPLKVLLMFLKLKDLVANKQSKIPNDLEEIKIDKKLAYNIAVLKKIFANDQTIIFREFEFGRSQLKCALIYVDQMSNIEIVNENIIQRLMNSSIDTGAGQSNLIQILMDNVLTAGNVKKSTDLRFSLESLLYGDALLLVDSCTEVLIIDAKGWKARAVEKTETEKSIRGPREGFTESIIINLSLIRRRLLTADFKVIFKQLGDRSKTKIIICYLDGLASKKVLKELERRIDEIKIDGVLDSGYIEELIKDAPLSPFKTVGSTERPDTVVGKLLEGRIAVLCDGSPFALTLPFVFAENFQSNEDYYVNFVFASFNRILRYLGYFLTVSVPAIYVALMTYHQEIIPTPLLLSTAAAREGVPFPTVVETFAMVITFELLREAGVRLPAPAGQTISIVGALVLGDAAVTAKFTSAPTVIIVALTGIASYLTPKMWSAILYLRLIFLIAASIIGMYGYVFVFIGFCIYLMSLRSFGVPYMLGYNTLNWQDIKDTVIRAPWWKMNKRPTLISKNAYRSHHSKKGR